MKHYLTAQEIAASLRVHVSWVYDHLKRRRPIIPSVRLGGAVRFDPDDVQAWLDDLKNLKNGNENNSMSPQS
jgi:excisionase family DNA binding protein